MSEGRSLLVALALLVGISASATPVRAQSEGPTLLFGGDVIFDDPIDYALRQMHRSRDDAASYASLFEELALGDADLTIVNLETPVGERVRAREDGYDVPVFAAPPAFLDAMARAGVDVVTVANNHAYDQGVTGLEETLAHAQAAGIAAVGAGADRARAFEALVRDVGGHRVALVSASEGVNLAARAGEPPSPRIALLDEALLARAVHEARARSELTIVALHFTDAGPESALPTDEMRAWCERAAEAGADLVIAHGPHVPGPRETVRTSDGREVVVLTSLGNLVAAMRADHDERARARPSVRDAVLARVRTRTSSSGRLAVEGIELWPFYIDVSPRAASGETPSRFVRPLSIPSEIARATGADCGHACEERARELAARRDRLAALFGVPAAPIVASTAPRPGATIPAPIEPETPAERVELGLVFAPASAREERHDDDAAHALAARLRADHRLRVTIVAHPAPGESRTLAARRAHHARGLVSVLGPSRARFDLTVGAPATDARVEVFVAPEDAERERSDEAPRGDH
ncbi:MAG: CapA family protein [Sandaracinus sp.]